MKTATSIVYIADDDADDRYFLRQAIQATDPSMMIVEAEDGDHLLKLLDGWIQGPEPHPVRLILPHRRTVRHEHAQIKWIRNATEPQGKSVAAAYSNGYVLDIRLPMPGGGSLPERH
ncbi:hypothetical protein [Spirosoma migulaei]